MAGYLKQTEMDEPLLPCSIRLPFLYAGLPTANGQPQKGLPFLPGSLGESGTVPGPILVQAHLPPRWRHF